MAKPLVLVILDGFGEREAEADNAVKLARMPNMRRLYAEYGHTLIGTSGPDVGLPVGQMGNSEVGHLNFGAGRIAMMDIARIDNAIADHTLGTNPVLAAALANAKSRGGRLHLMGLLSDGGVHSSIEHLFALIEMAAEAGVEVVVHAFLDGRDVQPGTASTFLQKLENHLAPQSDIPGKRPRGIIGTVAGRFYAMDRDTRWERTKLAYDAIVYGHGRTSAAHFQEALTGFAASEATGVTDEFVVPFVVGDYRGVDPARDSALHFNFRPDRARQLSAALGAPSFAAFPREAGPPFVSFACMTTYDRELPLPVAYPKEVFADVFGEVIARAGKKQYRCAETEKYAHVTYFFNGGREEPFPGEDRTMIPSPKDVTTYDQKPEMCANAVTAAVMTAIATETYDFILVNYANPDMVGHTGNLPAAVTAVEVIDAALGQIASAVEAKGGVLIITADHGNCELMRDPATGRPHTAHTMNPVPLLYVNPADKGRVLRSGGRLCDVAPTMLGLMGLPKPAAMTGVSLL
ncbi:MAG: 2,3-bisphosphoglycerate-independent phosphoglycerate mutase [Polyangiaceae bacterium]